MQDHRPIDENDLENLFDEFFQALCVFAESYVKDNALAVDMAQESFLALWFHRDRLRERGSIKSFLYTTVRNHCLNWIKKNRRRRQEFVQVESESFLETTIMRVETNRILYNAIDGLPPQTREIVLLSLDGLKNREIAEHLGVSENTVHTLKKSAYKKLKSTLDVIGSTHLFVHLFF